MDNRITRRQALVRGAGSDWRRIACPAGAADQLVNTLEYEEQARRVLPAAVAAMVADRMDKSGSSVDRQLFDRITLRPRMLVPTLDLDLGSHCSAMRFPHRSSWRRSPTRGAFIPTAKPATVQGASPAKAPVILSSHSSIPLADLSGSSTPLWYQVFAADPGSGTQMRAAAKPAAARSV